MGIFLESIHAKRFDESPNENSSSTHIHTHPHIHTSTNKQYNNDPYVLIQSGLPHQSRAHRARIVVCRMYALQIKENKFLENERTVTSARYSEPSGRIYRGHPFYMLANGAHRQMHYFIMAILVNIEHDTLATFPQSTLNSPLI